MKTNNVVIGDMITPVAEGAFIRDVDGLLPAAPTMPMKIRDGAVGIVVGNHNFQMPMHIVFFPGHGVCSVWNDEVIRI